jgi:hypothetical protein
LPMSPPQNCYTQYDKWLPAFDSFSCWPNCWPHFILIRCTTRTSQPHPMLSYLLTWRRCCHAHPNLARCRLLFCLLQE